MSFSWAELKKIGNLSCEKDLTNSTSGCIVFKCQYICISGVQLPQKKLLFHCKEKSYSNDKIGYNREERNNSYDKTLSDAFQHKLHKIFSGDYWQNCETALRHRV